MTPKEAAEFLGCRKPHIYRLISEGKLRATKVKTNQNRHGYELRIDKKELRRYNKSLSGVGHPRLGYRK